MPDRRHAERRELALTGAVVGPDGESAEPIFIENLASGGLKFRSDHPFEAGELISVIVPLDGQSFVLSGTVCHCGSDSLGCVIGLRFIDPEPEFVRELKHLILSAGSDAELVFA